MQIAEFKRRGEAFTHGLQTLESRLATGYDWYPYPTAANVGVLERLLEGSFPDIDELLGTDIADIGGADGDLAFYRESLGKRVDLRGPRRRLGPPCTKDHRTALAATLLAISD